jgi:recombination protein RecR
MKIVAEPITRLIEELNKLPTIGPKTASRLAFYILRGNKDDAQALAQAIVDVKDKIVYCSECFNLTEQDPCPICSGKDRDRGLICAVEEPLDVIAIERTRDFAGLYHVLHGHIDPLSGVMADDLRIRELLNRVKLGEVREVILAMNPNVEGRATAQYIHSKLVPLGVTVSTLATGLPVGGDLEYADEVTLSNALKGRRIV